MSHETKQSAQQVADACVTHMLQCRKPITDEKEHLAEIILKHSEAASSTNSCSNATVISQSTPILDEPDKCPGCGSDNPKIRFTARFGAMDVQCTHFWHLDKCPACGSHIKNLYADQCAINYCKDWGPNKWHQEVS
jgi:rRNA maturation protein Nop10